MDFIIYNENDDRKEMEKLNIFIDDKSKIGKNVKICVGAKIFNSLIDDFCEIGFNSIIKNSKLHNGVKVEASYIEDCEIGEGCMVGPFATLKKHSIIGSNCRVGNFVEIKKSLIGNNTKIAHLAYVGDAIIGDDCNVGCGVVFCNYNGAEKRCSTVGDRVFIGSNVNVVAPVKIEDETYIAAGSTIVKDVLKNQFAIARENQTNKNNFNNPYLKKFKNLKK